MSNSKITSGNYVNSIRDRQVLMTMWPVLFVLLGFAVRVFGIEWMPPFVHWDEVNHADQAQQVLRGDLPLFGLGYHEHPSISYLQYAPYLLWGGGLWALRITAALWGTLTLAATFFAVRQMFGQLAALYATILIAVAHVPVHFSRVGLTNVIAIFTSFVAIGLYLKAQQTGTKRTILLLLAGAAIGFNLYQYYATRAFFFGIAALWLCSIPRTKALWRSYARDTLLLAAGFLIIATPILWWYMQHPEDLTRRAQVFSIFGVFGAEVTERMYGKVDNLAILVYQTVRSLAGFFMVSDTSPNYRIDAPLLDPVTATLLVPGLVLGWYRNRRVTVALVVWGIVGLIGGAILTVEPPVSSHYILLVPITLVFAAVCLQEIATSFVHQALRPMMVSLLTLIVLLNLSIYFIHYPLHGAWISRESDLGYYVRSTRGCCSIFYLGNLHSDGRAIASFIAAPTQIQYLEDFEQLPGMLNMLSPHDWPAIIIIPNERADELIPRLSQLFPGGAASLFTDRKQIMFHIYILDQPIPSSAHNYVPCA